MSDLAGAPLRTLIITQRELRPQVARCHGYELERTVATMADPTWAAVRPGPLGRSGEVAVNRLNKRVAAAARVPAPMGRVEAPGEFDLALAVMQLPADIVTLASVRDWRTRSHRAVCFIEEIWAVELDKWKGHLRLLEQFDHVFVGSFGTVEPLAERLDTPVSYLPYGVDALRFAPHRLDTDRFIDVTNLGRRSPITHAALLDWARRDARFYYHDTFGVGPVQDDVAHRDQLGRLLRASNVAITNRGIGARAHETGYQQEIGFRFYEASAAGALLVGDPPAYDVVDELFDGPGAVTRVPFDDADIVEHLHELWADPDAVAAARRHGVEAGLTRHDHRYRWQQMLDAIGLDGGAATAERHRLLGERVAALS